LQAGPDTHKNVHLKRVFINIYIPIHQSEEFAASVHAALNQCISRSARANSKWSDDLWRRFPASLIVGGIRWLLDERECKHSAWAH